jgi:hypothetical protein
MTLRSDRLGEAIEFGFAIKTRERAFHCRHDFLGIAGFVDDPILFICVQINGQFHGNITDRAQYFFPFPLIGIHNLAFLMGF